MSIYTWLKLMLDMPSFNKTYWSLVGTLTCIKVTEGFSTIRVNWLNGTAMPMAHIDPVFSFCFCFQFLYNKGYQMI